MYPYPAPINIRCISVGCRMDFYITDDICTSRYFQNKQLRKIRQKKKLSIIISQ